MSSVYLVYIDNGDYYNPTELYCVATDSAAADLIVQDLKRHGEYAYHEEEMAYKAANVCYRWSVSFLRDGSVHATKQYVARPSDWEAHVYPSGTDEGSVSLVAHTEEDAIAIATPLYRQLPHRGSSR